MDSIVVSLLEPGSEASWDGFVEDSPSSTFFHLSGWKRVVEKAFGHKTFYLIARRRDIICGVLPLTHVKSFLFGNALISNAFCVQGGIVSDDIRARDELRAAAVRIGRERNVGWIEFRASDGCPDTWVSRNDLYAAFHRPIEANPESNLKAIPHARRRRVRVALENGLGSEIDDDVDRFYCIFAESVRNLGTPVYSRFYFQCLKEVFGRSCEIMTIVQGARAIASTMIFYFRDHVMMYYGGGLREARSLSGNDFMYWEALRRGCERGYRDLDFGRSKIGTGSYCYKRDWGCDPVPLPYEYFLVNSSGLPNNSPENPKYQTAIELWKRMPLSLTKVIGPVIVRSIG